MNIDNEIPLKIFANTLKQYIIRKIYYKVFEFIPEIQDWFHNIIHQFKGWRNIKAYVHLIIKESSEYNSTSIHVERTSHFLSSKSQMEISFKMIFFYEKL